MGKKIAVLIGNNYIGTQYRLYGCQNDVIKYRELLINNFGYKNEDIKMLLDLNGYEYPTKANIIKYMECSTSGVITVEKIIYKVSRRV